MRALALLAVGVLALARLRPSLLSVSDPPTLRPSVADMQGVAEPGVQDADAAFRDGRPRETIDEMRRITARLRALNRQWGHWPGAIVRDPKMTEPHYLHHRRLLMTLAAVIERNLSPNCSFLVADVGAGKKPYFPLLASRARAYVGIDLLGAGRPDVVGASEKLPLQSDSVDVVMSTQVLEHVDDPAEVLKESRRVLRPGGLMFASTHGTTYYHPIPVDHWRWTHTGLRLVFERAGFRVRSIHAVNGTLTTMATIIASHFLGLAHRFGCERTAALLLVPFNSVVGMLDRVHTAPPQSDSEIGWGALPCTYVVVAENPS